MLSYPSSTPQIFAANRHNKQWGPCWRDLGLGPPFYSRTPETEHSTSGWSLVKGLSRFEKSNALICIKRSNILRTVSELVSTGAVHTSAGVCEAWRASSCPFSAARASWCPPARKHVSAESAGVKSACESSCRSGSSGALCRGLASTRSIIDMRWASGLEQAERWCVKINRAGKLLKNELGVMKWLNTTKSK